MPRERLAGRVVNAVAAPAITWTVHGGGKRLEAMSDMIRTEMEHSQLVFEQRASPVLPRGGERRPRIEADHKKCNEINILIGIMERLKIIALQIQSLPRFRLRYSPWIGITLAPPAGDDPASQL